MYKPRPTYCPTKEQFLAFLADYDGSPLTREHLRVAFPDVPDKPLQAWALRLGLLPKKRCQYYLNTQQMRLLLDRYDGTTEALDRLMPHFPNVPRWKVKVWARNLGLSRRKEPPWTREDLEYLEVHLATASWSAMAKHLGRTIEACKLKAKRLGIAKSDDGYTLHALVQAFGEDHRVIERWIARGWLRGYKRHTDHQGKGDFWYFSDRALYAFIIAHPEEIDPRRLHRTGAWLWFIDLVAQGGKGLGPLALESIERGA